MGLVFMGQGSGYFPYPASSFMISESRWIYYGGAIAVVGLILIVMRALTLDEPHRVRCAASVTIL